MIEIEINNMLKIKSGTLKLEPGQVTSVVGPNASGKTSTATIVGALASREGNPSGGGKRSTSLYLNDDADAGGATLSIDGEPVVKWDAGSGELATFQEGHDPVTGGVSGLVDFCASTSPQARTALWESYFLPSVDVLRGKIKEQLDGKVGGTQLDEIMELIDSGDMSNVSKSYEARRRKAKEDWMYIAGSTWGSAKAADWVPEGWTADMDGMSETVGEEALEDAEAKVRALQVDQAVSATEIQQAREAVEKGKQISQEGKKLAALIESLKAKIDEKLTGRPVILSEREALWRLVDSLKSQKPIPGDVRICGACGAELLVGDSDKLEVHSEKAFEEAQKQWQSRLDDAEVSLKAANDKLDEFDESVKPDKALLSEKERKIESMRAEVRALKRLSEKAHAQVNEVDHDAMALAEKEVAIARTRLQQVRDRATARKHHLNILAYDEIVQILGPKGIRSTTMQEAMNKFRANLHRVHEITGWPEVELDNYYQVSIGGRTLLKVCSETERLRAQYAIQIALAMANKGVKNQVVVLDMVDHMTVDHQREMFTLLAKVCGTKSAPAFLLCGTQGHFSNDVLIDNPLILSRYEIFDGEIADVDKPL